MKKLVTVLHTNDIHSQLEQFARQATIIKQIKQENYQEPILTIDCGDIISGSIYGSFFNGKVEAECLNAIGYDYITLGNHEFDNGSIGLEPLLNNIDAQVITSNINFNKHDKLTKFVEKQKIIPDLIKEVSGVTMGFIGLTTLEIKAIANPDSTTMVIDPFMMMAEKIKVLKAKKAELIIVISHLGYDIDCQLANQFIDIDVILGGHTHTKLEKPKLIEQSKNQNCLICQAGADGKYVGALTIYYEKGSKLRHKYKLIASNQYQKDEQIEQVIAKYDQQINHKVNKLINKTTIKLEGTREVVRQHETNLGNLIADAFVFGAKKIGYNVDFGLINSGGIRKSLLPGSILYRDIIEVLPFNKKLTIIEVTGEQLYQSIDNGGPVQVANLQIIRDDKSLELYQISNGKRIKIDANKKYQIATNNYVAMGNDNFVGFSKNNIIEKTKEIDCDVVANYINDLEQPFTYEKEKRIIANKN